MCWTWESTCYTWRCNRWITSLLKPWYAVGVTSSVMVKACTHVAVPAGYAVAMSSGVTVISRKMWGSYTHNMSDKATEPLGTQHNDCTCVCVCIHTSICTYLQCGHPWDPCRGSWLEGCPYFRDCLMHVGYSPNRKQCSTVVCISISTELSDHKIIKVYVFYYTCGYLEFFLSVHDHAMSTWSLYRMHLYPLWSKALYV